MFAGIVDSVQLQDFGPATLPTRLSDIMKRPPLWKCPKCRRCFANRNQSHSCGHLGQVDHFRGKPPLIREIFDAFVAMAERCGPVMVLSEKTRIAFQVRMSFAALMPKRSWVDGHLVLAERRPSSHFRRIETFSRRNHLHAFRLERVEQLDREFQDLMRMAYAVGAQQHLDRRATDARSPAKF